MVQNNLIFRSQRQRYKQRGFSIIELMVAVAVLAIAASVAVPGFTQFIGNTQIRSTTESIRNGLQLARAEAVKRNTAIQFTLEDDSSWEVGCVTIADDCPAVIQAKPASEGAANGVLLEIEGGSTAEFTSLGTVTPAPGQLTQVDVDSKTLSAADSRNLRIILGAGGGLKMCDPSISAVADTRKC